MDEILNHLLQSTLFAAAVAVANMMLRRNSPRAGSGIRGHVQLAAAAGLHGKGHYPPLRATPAAVRPAPGRSGAGGQPRLLPHPGHGGFGRQAI
jgi:hypothetical protein